MNEEARYKIVESACEHMNATAWFSAVCFPSMARYP